MDGSFFFHGFTYLVEARWRQDKPTIGDLADFKFKVDGKIESTRGLFISMVGFDDEVLDHFASNSGTRRNVIYMTGHDLALIFGGHIGIVDALLMKDRRRRKPRRVPDRPRTTELNNGLAPHRSRWLPMNPVIVCPPIDYVAD